MKGWIITAAAVLGAASPEAATVDPVQNVAVLEHFEAVVKGGVLVKGPGAAR